MTFSLVIFLLSCKYGKYDKNCQENCGSCKDNAACNPLIGNCQECSPGYRGNKCKENKCVCRNGLYGSKCAEICGHCFNNEVCDHIDGHCTKCAAGYKGSDCKTECENGTFGFGCNEQCGKCLQGETCNKKNGTCNKCEPGYTDLLCKVLQNAELKSQYPEVNMYQLALAIAGTIAIVSIIGHVVIAICYVIRRRRKQRSRPIDFPPDISGPYELANRDDCGTEHQYGQTAPVYEEPEALYETPQ